MTESIAISDVRCGLGEGPLWHPQRGCLYVTDIHGGEVRVLDRTLRHLATIELNRTTTALTWQQDGSILCYHDRCAITRVTADGSRDVILEGIPGEEAGLFNDVIADCAGRVLCGAQPVPGRPGRLYCIEPDLTCRVLLDDLKEPNGMGFSPDGTTLYLCDSVACTISKIPYDSRTGLLGRREILFETEGPALPDGLTVDTEGFIWSAQWNGGRVVKFDPAGNIVHTVRLPALRTTSVAFGGPDYKTLFVTSARDGAERGAPGPTALDGAVFALEGHGAGRPEYPSRLGG